MDLILELDILQQILLSNITNELSSDLIATLDKLNAKLVSVYRMLLAKEMTGIS